jgi:nucleotide-binding universal stress UspA family protein
MSKVVVGWDGSAGAEKALAYAAEEARLRGAELVVVHAWQRPVPFVEAGAFGAVPVAVSDAYDHDALEKAHQDTLDKAREFCGDVDVHLVLTERHPVDALISESGDADLLVVGSRGRGDFAALLLGSVSHQCAHHARCPVTIVPVT